jgi:hypothetical protein
LWKSINFLHNNIVKNAAPAFFGSLDRITPTSSFGVGPRSRDINDGKAMYKRDERSSAPFEFFISISQSFHLKLSALAMQFISDQTKPENMRSERHLCGYWEAV